MNNVTNAEFMEFVESGGYRARELWSREALERRLQEEGLTHPLLAASTGTSSSAHGRSGSGAGCSKTLPLPPDWPVYVSQAEAGALRALEDTPAAHRSGIPSRGVRVALRRRAFVSLG